MICGVSVSIYRGLILGLGACCLFIGIAHADATLRVLPQPVGRAISPQILGANLGQWIDPTRRPVEKSFEAYGFTATRWPGGAQSDLAHWKTNRLCGPRGTGYINPHATFDDFMRSVVGPAKLDLSVTLNYGSNETCTGGGDPAEAAAWVAYAKAKGYKVSRWTVGNEVFNRHEYDLHAKPHSPTIYSDSVANDYYPAVKAADPTAQVGVVVDPDITNWDAIVLKKAKYDFVEYHWYAQRPGSENDYFLLHDAPPLLPKILARLRAELVEAGHPETPIYVGELGSVYALPGKQTMSITQSLFAGEVLSDLLEVGIQHATWWIGYGGCGDATSGNFAPSLYGWQNFSGYMMFSDGIPERGCPDATKVPLATPLPTIRAFELMSYVARPGEHLLGITQTGDTKGLRVIAATHGKGYVLFLINLNETDTIPVRLHIAGLKAASRIATHSYGKAQYDESQHNRWPGPTAASVTDQKLPFRLTLPVWSMTVVVIES
jgi:hypothetical protein